MKKLIIGNLKMNILSTLERDRYLAWMEREMKKVKLKNSEIILCPPYVHLEAFAKWKKKKTLLGAQDMFPESKGSFTGAISPVMLKNLGCEYVIIGHSERRRYFAESDAEINAKVIFALKNGLKPIICVGETSSQRDCDETMQVIIAQVTAALEGVSRAKAEQIVIAYEPIWSVGSDVVPSANDIMGAKLLIRKILVGLFGKKYAEAVTIIYGGSVSAKTVKQVCVDSGMDGALIGRESLQPHDFLKVAAAVDKS